MTDWAICWSPEARGDLQGIVEFIAARGDVENALAVFERIAASMDSLATVPERGRAVPEVRLAIEPPLLHLVEAPWRIMYACEHKRVIVTAIIDTRRDVSVVLESRFGRKLPNARWQREWRVRGKRTRHGFAHPGTC